MEVALLTFYHIKFHSCGCIRTNIDRQIHTYIGMHTFHKANFRKPAAHPQPAVGTRLVKKWGLHLQFHGKLHSQISPLPSMGKVGQNFDRCMS